MIKQKKSHNRLYHWNAKSKNIVLNEVSGVFFVRAQIIRELVGIKERWACRYRRKDLSNINDQKTWNLYQVTLWAYRISKCIIFTSRWDKVFKGGPNKFCGRQPLKHLKGYIWSAFKFFKGCLPQNLLSPLLNTLSQISSDFSIIW